MAQINKILTIFDEICIILLNLQIPVVERTPSPEARHFQADLGRRRPTFRAAPRPLPRKIIEQFSWRRLWFFIALVIFSVFHSGAASAVPSFAIQTGQPCAACHVGAFEPQLKPYGRDFKLHGYVASDGHDHGLPLAVTTLLSFTHTLAPQAGGAAPGFATNDNLALDQGSVYYAGRVTPWLGALVQVTYDGVGKSLHSDNTDIRHAGEGVLFGQDMLWGVTVNNSPTVTDPWNSTPVWGFPHNSSPLAPVPTASTLVDGQLGQRVAGAGADMLWSELVYAEFDACGGLDRATLQATGIVPDEGPRPVGLAPYGRLALIRDWQNSHLEVGAFGLAASVIPAGLPATGLTDQLTDLAVDATYQYIVNPSKLTSDMLSAHATFIHEWSLTPASQAFLGALPNHRLTTMRADGLLWLRRHGDAFAASFLDHWLDGSGLLVHAERQSQFAGRDPGDRLRSLGQTGFVDSRPEYAAGAAICRLLSRRRQPPRHQPRQCFLR